MTAAREFWVSVARVLHATWDVAEWLGNRTVVGLVDWAADQQTTFDTGEYVFTVTLGTGAALLARLLMGR